MATYAELFGLRMNDGLRQRVGVACLVAADKILKEPTNVVGHTDRLLWAAEVQKDAPKTAQQIWNAVLAQNRAQLLPALSNPTDEQLQTWVEAAVNLCVLTVIPAELALASAEGSAA